MIYNLSSKKKVNPYTKHGKDKRIWLGDALLTSGGSLQLKTPAEAMDLIELVATNQYMFTSDRSAK
ncbi:hypothetical protein PIB30_110218, partial [Stylosanthes scabra]|nr:hypothetical protein [Stylosanthes scabra]